ncbi:hypothetical protein [Streptomyces venezuelae]|uniref:hypothetical protein n=1 Tax=Streptomyces venezuelae TaxID=54571 RepID=UPI00123B21A7|nr:hypothetical protein [Streptomyces venezuelae]
MALILAAGVSACSDEGPSVPQGPERMCWNAFDRSDLLPLLGEGKKIQVEESVSPMAIDADCNITVDGLFRFKAEADKSRVDVGLLYDFPREKPDRIALGDEAVVWDKGAAVAFRCERPSGTDNVELMIHSWKLPAGPKPPRAANIDLIRKYFAFAQKELQCAPSPTPAGGS